MSDQYEYKCGKHGFYTIDLEREYDGEICPRIMCLECEQESLDPDPDKRPKDIPYFYKGELKVILGEAHRLSAVWKFNPPVVHPEFTFAEDLSPVLPEGALTSEEIMAKMEEMLPQVEEMAQNGGFNIPDPRDLLILPGKDFSVGSDD